ncbi:hypothetical protein CGCF415_v008787 [Colletotrichum fructicola]|uniref:Uncharacterized protein n=1 Tax=Colletotrichum fructicola (strain Nara gc5) TaxID=1213859 RepID=A0A7J6IKB4_COLFN|nr:uncharacterized protein CGMCC3_g15327 [Colletotrichum fructicola]KAF4476692.1 hypothetical protein CGGC5_v015004 [Colletotrichum fructicola Nara gc5]KAI8285221.1 hypothetical protein K4K60_001364 [Colletotrichum sp. SAR11_57]KAE9568610.1 hypothetical protein CGMCC3_g15327 [Colletotrichum fructicola]KAF4420466.1 hypothetical protein CFRS1_v015000 [Colletotrichum fructicola]KAF4885530.1 hypothetical protein CGCFRS4_v011896 [Colletotrichum fructicola]
MPDLNTVPASPHPANTSRRSSSNQISQQMPPPPVPASSESPSLNILPSNQNTVNNPNTSNPSLPSPTMAPVATSPPVAPEPSVSGPGPIRHPRPMTASDLHMQLEKEQEAVVNRLTRELQLLRTAQNASVVSNASSTSASNTTEAPADTHLLSGAAFSTPAVPSNSSRRHHRTASNASTRSQTAIAGSASVSTTSIPIPRPSNPVRQDSIASRHSLSSSPAHSQQHLDPHASGMTYFQQQRLPHQATGSTSIAATPGSESQLSPGMMPATSRYEETALHRQELEVAKKENEGLKQRIRELEKLVREKSANVSRERSESVSSLTTGGAGVGLPAPSGAAVVARRERPGGERERSLTTMSVASSVAVGVPEEEVQVGESAASSGLNP